MKASEIIYGLQCIVSGEVPCKDCPYSGQQGFKCKKKCAEDAIELIITQQSEIRGFLASHRTARKRRRNVRKGEHDHG